MTQITGFPFLVLVLISCAFSGSASAEAISWVQALNETAAHNSEVISSRESLSAYGNAHLAAYSNYLPQLSGSVAYTYSNTISSGVTGGGVTIPVQKNYSATLNASENLFTGLSDQGKISQANANEKNAAATFDLTRAKVSYDLKVAYAAMVFAQRSIKLQNSIIERRQQNLNLVQLRFESGRENKGSVMLSQAYLNQANYDLLQAKDNLIVARTQLARVLGRDEDSEFVIEDDVPLENVPSAQIDFKQLTVLTPTHASSVAQEEAAEAGVTIARSGFFPVLAVNGTLGKQGPTWFPQTERWSIAASITLPIFNGGRDYFGTRGAIDSYSAATATRFNGDRVTLTNLKQTYTSFVEANEKLKVDQSFAQATTVRAEIARNKYNNGLTTFDDWDIIENDLIAREKSVVASQQSLTTAEAAWQQTQGKGVIQ